MKKLKTKFVYLYLGAMIIFVSLGNRLYGQCNTSYSFTVTTMNVSALPTNVPGLLNTTTNTISSNFNLDGTLTVDQNLTITDANIDLTPNSKIIVKPGITLTISSVHSITHLQSCNGTGAMWEGIELQGYMNTQQALVYATLNIQGIPNANPNNPPLYPVVIEDAIHAVYCVPIPNVNIPYWQMDLKHVVFNRNYMHIDLHGPGTTFYAFPSIIQNCYFYCRANYLIPLNGTALHAPHTGKRTYAAINLLKTKNLTIGSATGPNVIDFADYGIKAEWSDVAVFNSTIRNNLWHIYDYYDGTLLVRNSTFSNADSVGIEARTDIEVNIYNNNFTTNPYGCRLHHLLSSVSLHDNIFSSSSKYGVYVYDTNTGTSYTGSSLQNVFIYNNTINSSATANGIFWTEFNPYLVPSPQWWKPTFKIYNNTFNTIRKAIDLNNVAYADVYDNLNINLAGGNNGFGIKITNCPNTKITHNSVVGNGATFCSDNTSGIINESSQGSRIECNTVDNTNKGFVYKYATGPTYFTVNKMQDCKFQFYLDNNAGGLGNVKFGRAASRNLWLPSSCENYRQTTGQNSNLVGFTKFHVQNCLNCNPNSSVLNSVASGLASTTMLTYALTSQPYCDDGGGASGNERMLDELLEMAENREVWNPDADASQWIINEYIYRELLANDSLVNGDSLLSALKDYLESTEISSMNDLLIAMNELMNDSTADSLDWEYIRAWNESLYNSSIASDNREVINSFLIIMAEEGTQDTTEGATSIYGVFDSTQYATIVAIANQCPLTGGSAVYTARAILASIEMDVPDYTDDCEDYSPPTERRRKINNTDKSVEKAFAEVYPNPAHKRLHINYNIGDNDIGTLQLIQSDGRLVLKKALSKENTVSGINIQDLTPGVYQLIIKAGQNIIIQKRIVII